jgi:hypothetical protein
LHVRFSVQFRLHRAQTTPGDVVSGEGEDEKAGRVGDRRGAVSWVIGVVPFLR